MQETLTIFQRLQPYRYNMEAFEAYKIYHALKLHFTSDYDYAKYNGKAKVTVDSYLKRKDRPFFAKVARKYMTTENTKNFFISNFIVILKDGLVILMKKTIQNIVKEIKV